VKVTLIVQLALAANDAPQLFVCGYTLGVVVICCIVNGRWPALASTTGTVALLSTATGPKFVPATKGVASVFLEITNLHGALAKVLEVTAPEWLVQMREPRAA